MATPSKSAPRVVIVGAGFGGLNAARSLARDKVQITIVDRKNHHTFQPLLYQVATAALSPGEIAEPIRSVFRSDSNVISLLEEVQGFDLDRRLVHTGEQDIPYDYLVVAAAPHMPISAMTSGNCSLPDLRPSKTPSKSDAASC